MAFILFIFFVAAAISSVAAYFSLVGLGSIFAASFWGVVVMAGTLEVGKIVATKWVHGNWRNPAAPWYFRGLICFFIACLMAITSLGIYGYLSRGHLEQQAPLAGLGIQVAQLEQQVKQKQDENVRLEGRLTQISKVTDKVLEGNARAGLRASNQSKREAAAIQKSIDTNNQTINDLTTRLVPLKVKTGDVQGELGVAKFIAEAAGWEPEKAIRIIISLIMAAFDPLALSMFIMGSISLKELQNKRRAEKQAVDSEPTIEPVADPVAEPDPVPAPVEIEPQPLVDHDALVEERMAVVRSELDAEHNAKLHALNEQSQALHQKQADFDASVEVARTLVEQEVTSVEEQKKQNITDAETLRQAHDQLIQMEARLADEQILLKNWEDQLTSQQNAINNWTPLDHDPRSPQEKIIEMLEQNPEVVNDIVSVVDAMRPPVKPGL